MKILITGASGLVGSALVSAFSKDGHTVCRLIRPGAKTEGVPGAFDVSWNPDTGELGGAAVGAEAVVNLAGASIAGGRWSEARKKVLRESRVRTTRALVGALEKMNARPSVLISASAIGYYGNRGDEQLNEESAAGHDFLASVAQEWEAEALRAEALRTRVVLARFGIILAKEGGALPQMMRPFKLGVGGRLGPGTQWMSWVSLEDVVSVLRRALSTREMSGAINVVSPHPVTNREFTQVLARVLHRPALIPAPAFALRLALGREMADAMLLASQRVLPQKLLSSGFSFAQPELSRALHSVISER